MFEFYPVDEYPFPKYETVLVHLIDDQVAFAHDQSDIWDTLLVIQLPFKPPQGAHHGMIKDWAYISEKKDVN